jgi:sugar transferase (PEP-CTERM/EpsH1 system associated)
VNILFVTPRIPYPLDTGAKIRTFNLLKQAKTKGHNLTLLSFAHEEKAKIYAETIEEMGIEVVTLEGKDTIGASTILKALIKGLPLAITKYYDRKMVLALNRITTHHFIDLVHFDHLHLGQYADRCNGTPVIIDEHNIESGILKRLHERESNFIKRIALQREYGRVAKLEKEKCLRANKVFVVSEQDRNSLKGLCQNGFDAEVIPNGVDTEYFRSQGHKVTRSQEEESLVFTGSMDWMPNSDAVKYFCNDILPLIWREKKDVKFYVVGKNPPKEIIELGKKNKRIVVTGRVEDVRPYIDKAKAFVAPLRVGGGTRLKILEAMSMQKAVVSTTLGAEGIDYTENSDILLADSPRIFANKVISLLENTGKAAGIGLNARKLVCDKYDWGTIGEKLNSAYREVIKC